MVTIVITNVDEAVKSFRDKFFHALGQLIVAEIQDTISTLGLVDTNLYRSTVDYKIEDDALVITNNAEYAMHLEFGTEEYFQLEGDKWSRTADPKKKGLKSRERKQFPKGMQPFAPYRKVLYNEVKMKMLIDKAAKIVQKSL